SGMSYFQSFHFSIFSFPEAFFPQNAAFPELCALECLISKVFIFRFLASQKLFFAKRFISGVLRFGMSYFLSFLFFIFIFFYFVFSFFIFYVLFFLITFLFRLSSLLIFLFSKFSFFYF